MDEEQPTPYAVLVIQTTTLFFTTASTFAGHVYDPSINSI
jgi:hypothetical protein